MIHSTAKTSVAVRPPYELKKYHSMSERNIANKTNLETIKMKVVRNGQSNVYIIFTNVEFIKKKS